MYLNHSCWRSTAVTKQRFWVSDKRKEKKSICLVFKNMTLINSVMYWNRMFLFGNDIVIFRSSHNQIKMICFVQAPNWDLNFSSSSSFPSIPTILPVFCQTALVSLYKKLTTQWLLLYSGYRNINYVIPSGLSDWNGLFLFFWVSCTKVEVVR